MRILSLFLLALLAAPAMAAEPSYNFVAAGYQSIDIDDVAPGINVDGDGFGIGGSFELNDSFHVFASYGTADFDFGVDLDELQLGVGYRMPMSDKADFIISAAWVQAEVSALGFSVDDDGFGASLGVRGYVNEKFELAGNVSYVDFGDGGDDTSVGGAARYHLMPNLALELGADFADDITTYGIGVRLYFDN